MNKSELLQINQKSEDIMAAAVADVQEIGVSNPMQLMMSPSKMAALGGVLQQVIAAVQLKNEVVNQLLARVEDDSDNGEE